MKKISKIGLFVFIAVSFLFPFGISLVGCGEEPSQNPQNEQTENQKFITGITFSVGNNDEKYTCVDGRNITVKSGTTLTREDIALSSVVITYSDNSTENINTNDISIKWVDGNVNRNLPIQFEYSHGQYMLCVTYQSYSEYFNVNVTKSAATISGIDTPISFTMQDVFASNLEDGEGKYIDLIAYIDAMQPQGGVTLANLLQNNYISYLYDANIAKVHHGTGYDAYNQPNNVDVVFSVDYSCPYELPISTTDGMFHIYYNVAPILLSTPTVDDTTLSMEFDITKKQAPSITLNAQDQAYADYITVEKQYNANTYNSIFVRPIDGYYSDFAFFNSSTQQNENTLSIDTTWSITPKVLALPTLVQNTKVYDGQALNIQVTNIPEIIAESYLNVEDLGNSNVGEHSVYLVFDNDYKQYGDTGNSYSINDFVWAGGNSINNLYLEYTITKANYSLPQGLPERLTINIDYDYSVDTLIYKLNNTTDLATIISSADYQALNNVHMLDYGYSFEATQNVTNELLHSLPLGTHDETLVYVKNNNYNGTNINVSIVVNKAMRYVGLLDWYDVNYTYNGSAKDNPTIYNYNSDIFVASYTTYNAVYNNQQSKWVKTGSALADNPTDAGHYVTEVAFASDCYIPMGNSNQGYIDMPAEKLSSVWSIEKAQVYGVEVVHDLFEGSYKGTQTIETQWGQNYRECMFSYHTGSAKTMTVKDYYSSNEFSTYYPYITGFNISYEYSVDGYNWEDVDAAELVSDGYYRTNLAWIYDSNNYILDYDNGCVEWRIYPNQFAVDDISFAGTPNVYTASENSSVEPELPANVLPTYLMVTYTRYKWNADLSNWYELESNWDYRWFGTYKIVATLSALSALDGAAGVTYERGGNVILDEFDNYATSFTVEFEYTVNKASASEFTMPEILENGEFIIYYEYQKGQSYTKQDMANQRICYSGYDVWYDCDVVLSNNMTSRYFAYNGNYYYFKIDENNISNEVADAILNHTDTPSGTYLTIGMQFTPDYRIYEMAEFTARFYIKAKYSYEMPKYVEDLIVVYEFNEGDPATSYSAQDFVDIYAGHSGNLLNTARSIHFDNTTVIYDNKNSLQLATSLDNEDWCEGSSSMSYILDVADIDSTFLSNFNNHVEGSYTLNIKFNPNTSYYEDEEVTIHFVIRKISA